MKKTVRWLEKEEASPLDKNLGRLSQLEWYNWELRAENLKISESDNVLACVGINETTLAETKIQAHCSSLANYKPSAKIK